MKTNEEIEAMARKYASDNTIYYSEGEYDRIALYEAFIEGFTAANQWVPVGELALISLIDCEVLFWHNEGRSFTEIVDKDSINFYLQVSTHYKIIEPPTKSLCCSCPLGQ